MDFWNRCPYHPYADPTDCPPPIILSRYISIPLKSFPLENVTLKRSSTKMKKFGCLLKTLARCASVRMDMQNVTLRRVWTATVLTVKKSRWRVNVVQFVLTTQFHKEKTMDKSVLSVESKFPATNIKVLLIYKHLITDRTCPGLDSILSLSLKDSTYAQSVTVNRTILKSAVSETTTKNFAARIAKSRLTPTIRFRTLQSPRPRTMDNPSNITGANIRKRRIRLLPKF